MQVTKQMLGIQTRKRILYLDQHLFSLAFREKHDEWVDHTMEQISDLLDLQLLAIPYSPIHIAEADLFKERDALVRFIQKVSRGHFLKAPDRVEQTQIVKAFQAFLANKPAQYVREERDAIPESIHDWDAKYSANVFTNESDFELKRTSKQGTVDALVLSLSGWAEKGSNYETDIDLEFRDAARTYKEEYARKARRILSGDFAALADSPNSTRVVEILIDVAERPEAQPQSISAFFASTHFRETPSQQLSARLYSAFKDRLRTKAHAPNPAKAQKKLSGLMFDVQHAATYAPYSNAFFADKAMADLMSDKRVAIETTYGCQVFSASRIEDFLRWLAEVRSSMTSDHLKGLRWAYPKYQK